MNKQTTLTLFSGSRKQCAERGCVNYPWFNKPDVIIKLYDDRMEFTNPSMDYRGKTNVISHISKNCNELTVPIYDESYNGKYLIKEENVTEDLLTIYYEDKI